MKYTDQFIRKANLWYGDTGASLLVPQITISSGRSETEMATHSSILAYGIPGTEEPGRLQSMGSRRVGHDWATSLSIFTFMHWRRKRQPIPVFLPGESQGRGAWWAAVYGVAQSRTRLKWLSSSMHRRRKWQPTPVFLPGECQGQGSLLGCRLWDCTGRDTTEAT